MFTLRVLLFMALFTVSLAHRYEWFHTRISSESSTPLFKVAKYFPYTCPCHKLSTSVNRRGLMLLLLLGSDLSHNPGPLIQTVLNARSIRNKGPQLADIVTSHDLDFLCLTETHVRVFDTDSILQSLLLLISYFVKGLVPQVLVLVFFLDPPTNHIK